jgi:hypothetical protein
MYCHSPFHDIFLTLHPTRKLPLQAVVKFLNLGDTRVPSTRLGELSFTGGKKYALTKGECLPY